MSSPSTPTHTTVMWGLPSRLSVVRWARLPPARALRASPFRTNTLRSDLIALAGDRTDEAGTANPRVVVVDGDVFAVQVHLHAVDAFERADRALEGVDAVLAGNFGDGQAFLSHDSLLLVQSSRHRIAGPPL